MDVQVSAIPISFPEGANIVVGQSHFIKTVEDIAEIMNTSVPGVKYGLAFSEASGPCLVRTEGNDDELIRSCASTLQSIGAGHVFCILLRNVFPVNVLNQVKNCPEVCHVFCATANALEVVVAASAQGKGILGVIDGFPPKGVETGPDRAQRREFLRTIGYKL